MTTLWYSYMDKYAIFITILAYGIWNFAQKMAVSRMHPFWMLVIGSCVSVVMLPFYFWLTGLKPYIGAPTISGVCWTVVASLCAVAGALSFLFAIRQGEVSKLSVLSSASPIITCFLAILFLGERLTLVKVLGIVLVLFGAAVLGY
jgi:bacterial/archaeal transporter family protein